MLFGILSPGADSFPFTRLDPAPAEGVGLTPLLRHPAMAIHPPMLYSGYVLFSIPFAFAIAALLTRRLDAAWIRATRRFALVAWLFLGTGILLGSFWSYNELGWGGYWGWDPVENASLMPWLLGTAFLHSVMVQEKRGMLRTWNVSLVVATFALCLLGTFLVRSGILESIHAFGVSKVGGPLLALIAVVVVGSAALIVSRLDDLRGERRIESLASREAVFLVNNLLLVGALRGDLLGHVLPADLRGAHGRRALGWAAVLQRGHDAAGDPAGAVHRDRAAARLAAGQRGAGLAAALAAGGGGAGRRRGRSRWSATPPPSPPRWSCSASPRSRWPRSASEFAAPPAAQRALAGGCFGRRWRGWWRATAAATAATSSTPASRSCSSRSPPRRASRPPPTCACSPGESRDRRRLRGHLRRSPSAVDRPGRAAAHLRRDARRRARRRAIRACCSPSRNYYSSAASDGVRGFFEGEATSEVGRKGRPGGDFWTAMRPDLAPFDERHRRRRPPASPRCCERVDEPAPNPAAASPARGEPPGARDPAACATPTSRPARRWTSG